MPSSETLLNRSLHALFCLFLSDDLNYLIITIGYLRWKINCFRHRRNFSPSSCSESLPLQWQHGADIPRQLGKAAAGLCTWLSTVCTALPRHRGNPLVLLCLWVPWPRWTDRTLMGLSPSVTLLPTPCISPSIQQGHLRNFYQMYDIA